MDRGAWRVLVHRVAKSRTWLKWLSTHRHTQKSCLIQSHELTLPSPAIPWDQHKESWMFPILIYHLSTLGVLDPPGYAAAAKSLQSCLTLCDTIDGSTPSSISLTFWRSWEATNQKAIYFTPFLEMNDSFGKHGDDSQWVPGSRHELCDVGPYSTKVGRQRSLLQFCVLPHEKECWRFRTLKTKEEHRCTLNPAVSTLGWAVMPQCWMPPSRVHFLTPHQEREWEGPYSSCWWASSLCPRVVWDETHRFSVFLEKLMQDWWCGE